MHPEGLLLSIRSLQFHQLTTKQTDVRQFTAELFAMQAASNRQPGKYMQALKASDARYNR